MVNGAIQVFRERGVAGTSLTDIVERTGAPRGSVYHYFPDGKAQLAEHATDHAGRIMSAMISSVLSAAEPAEALDEIVSFFRESLIDSGYDAGCPVAAGALAAHESEGAREAAGEAFSSWESTIATALWQRGLSKSRAEVVATMVISAIEGALIVAKAQRSPRPLDRVADELRRYAAELPG
ncbi:TetR/AcrR family transcriptional regulator [Haloechinothrix sp. LS1_15]|nr:TetR/AcrR family transcriptional regulator [Haloechinothrix sp. LS1_15]